MKSEYAVKRNLNVESLFRDQPLLEHLDIELTERCNNACMHCYINLPQHDLLAQRKELSTDQWKHILQQAADLGALSVRFTGGEPLLRDDFTEIYLHARQLGMNVVLFTNARLITPELALLFAKIPLLRKIEVSVYGMYPQSYDTIARKSGAYQEFRRGLDLLVERHIPFVVKSVLLPPNKDEIESYEAWAENLTGNSRPSYSVFLDLRTRRDSEAKNRLIANLRLSAEEGLALLTRDHEAYRKSIGQFFDQFIYFHSNELFNCGAGVNGCVDAYGNYQMCILLRHPDTIFDLNQGSLKEALTDFSPRVRQMRASNPAYLQRCACCFLNGLCEQCPAKSWSEHGTLDTPVEYLCEITHAQARYLGLLKEGEKAWEIEDWHERIKILNK
jgi:radical SAM protein with 4Fe4S-binding SPASM domain